jgi:hypothetical protein
VQVAPEPRVSCATPHDAPFAANIAVCLKKNALESRATNSAAIRVNGGVRKAHGKWRIGICPRMGKVKTCVTVPVDFETEEAATCTFEYVAKRTMEQVSEARLDTGLLNAAECKTIEAFVKELEDNRVVSFMNDSKKGAKEQAENVSVSNKCEVPGV